MYLLRGDSTQKVRRYAQIIAVMCYTGLGGGAAVATTGLTSVPSDFGQVETINRLEAAISAAGMTVFARIDHRAAATAVHLSLGPTEVVIFGNARGGTPLMQASQAVGIDLPLKVLIYQDGSDKVWVAYNEPNWLAQRHGLGAEVATTLAAMTSTLRVVVANATGSHAP